MDDRAFWFESLAYLLREAPGLMGERSNMGSQISALESGGAGATVASSDEHHGHLIDRLDAVARVRKLDRTWQLLAPETRLVLQVYYEPRVHFPMGCQAFLGNEASVALAFATDRQALLTACSNATRRGSQETIEAAKQEALARIKGAHEEWTLASLQTSQRRTAA